jgi:hypothetical protein
VAPRTRVAYVPTTTLVACTAAVREVGAPDERMAFGEDVDLIWRLVEAATPCATNRRPPSPTPGGPT